MVQGLINRVAAGAIVVAAAIVTVVALGYAIYFGLAGVFQPGAAAAITALLFAVVALIVVKLAFGKASPNDDDEDMDEHQSLTHRVIGMVRERPVLGVAAGLAAGWIFLRNPALAAIVAAAMNNGGHHRGHRQGRSRRR